MRRPDGPSAGRPVLLALVLLAVWPSGRLAAQTDARLVEALRLAQSGQVDSDRAIVRRLLATLPPTDSVYPQALLAAPRSRRTRQPFRRIPHRCRIRVEPLGRRRAAC
jgi:hypothetical protein